MKYLKTNEALFTNKSEKIFEKLLQNFENKLTEKGLEFEKRKNDLWFGRTPKSILKRVDYLIIEKNAVKDKKSHFEYKYAIALIKESTFDKPFTHSKCECSLSLGDLISVEHKCIMEIIQDQLSESPISIFGLMDPCKNQVLNKYINGNKKKDFYQSFTIEDIKDRLNDISDEFGVEFSIEQIKNGINGYDVKFELSLNFETRDQASGLNYVKADMDLYSKLIIELNSLYKFFDSMGLSLYFDPFRTISGSVYLQILEKKEKPDE